VIVLLKRFTINMSFKRTISLAFIRKSDQPAADSKQAQGKKFCSTCDQLYANELFTCPHCKEDDNVPLGEGGGALDDSDWLVFEGEVARLRKKEDVPESRKELVKLLFNRAMAVRYKEPYRSRDLFAQVVKLDPDNYEARIKISWLDIKFKKLNEVVDILKPVCDAEESTVEQKKRAYNNICCSYMFGKQVDIESASYYAKKGIEVDNIGTDKLWENYGSILMNQHKYMEAREGFTKAVLLEPNSEFAKQKLEQVEKILKKLKKR